MMPNDDEDKKVVVRPSADMEVKEEAPLMEQNTPDDADHKETQAAPVENDKNEEDNAPQAEVEIHVIDDRDEEAESLIRWGAARAGVIVVAPLLGTGALVLNEMYMISKLGSLYGVEISHKAILSFIGSLGAAVVGSTLATLVPLSIMQVPIGVSVTYGVGQAAFRWIKDGMPDDTKPYKELFEKEKHEAKDKVDELKDNPNKDIPLGDEGKDALTRLKESWDDVYPKRAHEAVDMLADRLTEKSFKIGAKILEKLKQQGVTDEQIDKAKYTAMGAGEVAQEMAKQKAEDLKKSWKNQSEEFKKQALEKAKELKQQTAEQSKAALEKAKELKQQTAEQSKAALEKSRVLREQAKVSMQKVKENAEKAKNQANELKNSAKESSAKYGEAAKKAAQDARDSIQSLAEEYQGAVVKRAQKLAAKDKKTIFSDADQEQAKPNEPEAQTQEEKPTDENKQD